MFAASSSSESKPVGVDLAAGGVGPDEVAGAMDDVVSECSGSSSPGSSSSGSDTMVMQKAAVHVGDYVLVAPFGSSSGDVACAEGWVKDYVSDEAWQTSGGYHILLAEHWKLQAGALALPCMVGGNCMTQSKGRLASCCMLVD
jgi:hypothetical protein